eukprot:12414020-Karenia_brevis.AAC.1
MEDEHSVMVHGYYKYGYVSNIRWDIMETLGQRRCLSDIERRTHHHLLMSGKAERLTTHQHLES